MLLLFFAFLFFCFSFSKSKLITEYNIEMTLVHNARQRSNSACNLSADIYSNKKLHELLS